MANRTLNTRLVLRYDKYQNWIIDTEATRLAKTGANLVLAKGEIGLCEVNSDTVVFKVGDGDRPFKDLPWASANAADVPSWAKASEVELIDNKLVFIGGNPDGTDKEIPFNYVTLDEVKAITDDLESRVAVLEATFEGDSDSGLDNSLIESAKAYTDTEIAEVISTLHATEAALEDSISSNTTAISNIEKKLGGEYSESNTVYSAITVNTANIASNASDIAANTADIAELGSRIEKVEAEIREYPAGGTTSPSGDLASRVAQNEADIKSIQELVVEGGALESRIAENEASIADISDRADYLTAIVKGYTTEGAIKVAIEATDRKASEAQTKANNLATIVGNENSGLVQLVNLVKDTTDVIVIDIADLVTRVDTAESTIADIQSIINSTDSNAKLREDITDIQSIVKTGANANATLRADLTALQDLVNNKDAGLGKVKEIADEAASLAADNASRISVIEEDYLKEADNYLFSCGSASTITFSN
jgi:chromosome segregation ATPase